MIKADPPKHKVSVHVTINAPMELTREEIRDYVLEALLSQKNMFGPDNPYFDIESKDIRVRLNGADTWTTAP